MNLKEALLEDHSRRQCDRIVAYIGRDRRKFARLMELFFQNEYRVCQRAAYPMSYCVREHPDLITPYLGKLIHKLEEKNVHDAVVRNTLRILEVIDVPPKYDGKLMNACFGFIQSTEAPAAIKAFSLTVLQNLRKRYPEIASELKVIIEDRMPHESAAFKSRARKILKTI